MLVCHPEQILPPHSRSKQRSDLSGCFGVFADPGTTQEQLCFGMPGCCCNERRLQASQLPPLSRRRSMREGSGAQKLARPAARRPGRRSVLLLASSQMKLQGRLPAVSSTYRPLRGRCGFGAVHRSPVYVVARDMDRSKRNSPPGRPSHLTSYVSNSLALVKRKRHQTARSSPAYSNPQASGHSFR
jgi:hypothetical protein